MGQGDVIDKLNKKEWLTSCEIRESIGYLSHSSVTESLRRLKKKEIIETKQDPSCSHGYLYRLK